MHFYEDQSIQHDERENIFGGKSDYSSYSNEEVKNYLR